MLIDKLKECMFARDYSIADAADEMHCSPMHLHRIIHGKSRITERFEYKIKRFCGILNESKKEIT